MNIIGSGAYGTVRQEGDGKAVKTTTSPDAMKAFLREASIQTFLTQGGKGGTMPISSANVDNRGRTVIQMRLMDSDMVPLVYNMTHQRIIEFAIIILQTLDYLHKNNVAHRDLKPSNILVDGDDRGFKLADFGLSKFQDPEDSEETHTENVISMWYKPPELVLGQKNYRGSLVDMWSFGVILMELITREKFPLRCNTEVILLRAIISLIGKPPKGDYPEEVKKWLGRIPDDFEPSLEKLLKSCKVPDVLYIIITNTLTYRNRWSAKEALNFCQPLVGQKYIPPTIIPITEYKKPFRCQCDDNRQPFNKIHLFTWLWDLTKKNYKPETFLTAVHLFTKYTIINNAFEEKDLQVILLVCFILPSSLFDTDSFEIEDIKYIIKIENKEIIYTILNNILQFFKYNIPIYKTPLPNPKYPNLFACIIVIQRLYTWDYNKCNLIFELIQHGKGSGYISKIENMPLSRLQKAALEEIKKID